MQHCHGLGQVTLIPGDYSLVSVDKESDGVEPRAKFHEAKGSFSSLSATQLFSLARYCPIPIS